MLILESDEPGRGNMIVLAYSRTAENELSALVVVSGQLFVSSRLRNSW